MASKQHSGVSSSSKFKQEADKIQATFFKTAKRHFLLMYMSLVIIISLSISLLISFVVTANTIIPAYLMMSLLIMIFFFLLFRIWVITQYPKLITRLRDRLIDMRAIINYQEGVVQHHYWIAQKMCRFVDDMYSKTSVNTRVKFFSFLPARNLYEQWLNERLNEWSESIVLAAANEYIKLIYYEPLNKDVHWQLADTYLYLARMYQKRKDLVRTGIYMMLFQDEPRVVDSKKIHYAEKALQEYEIIKRFGDPNKEIYIQSASVYRLLNDPKKECQELEKSISIDSDNLSQWFKLGVLYFQNGDVYRGLEVYKRLKSKRYENADKMMIFYAGNKHESQ
ncbi:hypothetical protein N9N03_01375 [Chlamydiia bacterium]|nr:hypothetical protein [Chlamydiia bacterium]